MPTLRTSTMIAAGLIGLASLPALAQDAIVLTGAEMSRDARYAYLGTVLPLPGSKLGQGWVQRYWVDYNTYSYEQTPVQDIDAKVGGVEALLGYQASHDGNWWSAYLGVRYANTSLSPDDPSNASRGGRVRAKIQFEGEAAMTDSWRINGILSHLSGDSDYYLRLRVLKTLGNGLKLGPELITQGDSTYRAAKFGICLGGIKAGADSELTLRLGASKAENKSAAAYLGVEAYIPF